MTRTSARAACSARLTSATGVAPGMLRSHLSSTACTPDLRAGYPLSASMTTSCSRAPKTHRQPGKHGLLPYRLCVYSKVELAASDMPILKQSGNQYERHL